jgi:hypothetical protein
MQIKMPNVDVAVDLFLFDCAGQSIFNKVTLKHSLSAVASSSGRKLMFLLFDADQRLNKIRCTGRMHHLCALCLMFQIERALNHAAGNTQ